MDDQHIRSCAEKPLKERYPSSEYISIHTVDFKTVSNAIASGSIMYHIDGAMDTYQLDWVCEGTNFSFIGEPIQVMRTVSYTPVKRFVSPRAMKRVDEKTIAGYGVVFGDEHTTDLEGDFFTKRTDFFLDYYDRIPIFFDHAIGMPLPQGLPQDLPRHYKFATAFRSSMKLDDIGLWIEAVIDEHSEWEKALSEEVQAQRAVWKGAILNLIDEGMLHWSSGTAPHLIKRAPSGEVLSWAFIECSATPSPAEPRRTQIEVQKKSLPQEIPSPRVSTVYEIRPSLNGFIPRLNNPIIGDNI